MRSIVINVDPHKLLDYNVTPQQVIDALAKGNTIIPAGNIYIKDSMPVVSNNATVVDIKRLGEIPLKLGLTSTSAMWPRFQDDTDITYGYALVNGKKSVYLPIIKKDTGSTLTVVADVHKSMQLFRDAVPKDVSVNFEFDESPTVVASRHDEALDVCRPPRTRRQRGPARVGSFRGRTNTFSSTPSGRPASGICSRRKSASG